MIIALIACAHARQREIGSTPSWRGLGVAGSDLCKDVRREEPRRQHERLAQLLLAALFPQLDHEAGSVVVGAAVHRAPRGVARFAGMKADRRVATGLREENGRMT